MHHGAPQAGGFEHVCLVDAGDLFAAQTGQLKGPAADALDFLFGIGHQVGGLFSPVLGLIAIPLAEVDAAGKLAHHHQVDALFSGLLFQGAGVDEGGTQCGGTEIGVKPQVLADGQQALFRAQGGGQIVPFGAAHRAQQHRVAGSAQRGGSLGIGGSGGVDGAAAQQHIGVGEAVTKFLAHRVQHPDGLGNHLGADTVAPDQRDFVIHWAASLAFRDFSSPPSRMMPWIKGGKGAAWKEAPVVLLVMTPAEKSTVTSSPAEMPETASGHSRMGKPMLMALR
ncbi:hypothetical protein SDC9_124111 [bioreactor metagenome]|uniref:Uncharacterized protein n=1 Tax=bioreactor metagenome TaxID=1076179 RepID=A0A645CJI1_9ZZZZ